MFPGPACLALTRATMAHRARGDEIGDIAWPAEVGARLITTGTPAITKRSRVYLSGDASTEPDARRRKPKSSGPWHRDTPSGLARQRETPAPAMMPSAVTDGCPQSVDGCVEMNTTMQHRGTRRAAAGFAGPGNRGTRIGPHGAQRNARLAPRSPACAQPASTPPIPAVMLQYSMPQGSDPRRGQRRGRGRARQAYPRRRNAG